MYIEYLKVSMWMDSLAWSTYNAKVVEYIILILPSESTFCYSLELTLLFESYSYLVFEWRIWFMRTILDFMIRLFIHPPALFCCRQNEQLFLRPTLNQERRMTNIKFDLYPYHIPSHTIRFMLKFINIQMRIIFKK